MLTTFFLIFTFFSILYLLDIENKTLKNIVLIFSGVILILVAGLREEGIEADYYIYQDFWLVTNLRGTVEYSFYIIRNFLKYQLEADFQYLLLTYAFLGVTAKLLAIRKFAPFVWGSLIVYFSHYFILHEFVQIRIGVATGFMLLSLYFLANSRIVLFFVLAAIAIFFHQSCFFIVFFPLLRNSEKNIKYYYLIVPLGYALYFFNTYLDLSIPIPGIQEKIDIYQEATESGFLKEEKTNVFNALFLIRIVILNVLIYFSKKISPHFNGFYLLVKIYSFSLFSFLFLAKIPVFAFRTQELLGVVEIILIPCLIFIFPQKIRLWGWILVWAIALMIFLLDIFYVKLIFEI